MRRVSSDLPGGLVRHCVWALGACREGVRRRCVVMLGCGALLAATGAGCKGINWGVDFAGDGAGIGASVTAAGIRVGVSFASPLATNRAARVATNEVAPVRSAGP